MGDLAYRDSRARYVLAPFKLRHYRSALGIVRTMRRPLAFLRRYATGRGELPADIPVRTPIGPQTLRIFMPADLQTVNEIFCRHDYPCPDDARVVVDIGSNIGISAAYFLTRNPECRVWCYEPVSFNIERLRHNLAPFEGRWTLDEAAVSTEDGEVEFGLEPTGRYGGLHLSEGAGAWDVVRVPCRSINTVLRSVLEEVDRIDLLKIDTEGLEPATVAAIEPELASRIGTIVYESPTAHPVRPDLYAAHYDGAVNRLRPLTGAA